MKYYVEDGTLYAMEIFQDQCAEDPLELSVYDRPYHMPIWWNNYQLGDYSEVDGRSPVEYLEELISDRLPDAETYGKSPLELLQILYSDDDFLALPLYIYEHGMLTISTSDIVNPYGHWDSGMAGFIWTTRDEFAPFAYSEDWRKDAKKHLQYAVEEYDMYLLGEVYAVETTPYNVDLQDFDDSAREVICGYYSREYGDALYAEIAADVTNAALYDDYESAVAV